MLELIQAQRNVRASQVLRSIQTVAESSEESSSRRGPARVLDRDGVALVSGRLIADGIGLSLHFLELDFSVARLCTRTKADLTKS